ncbi:MAG: MotA/TolQ/ExbB proton channel family protein [Lachnospiraceae bacterium]|nr:MotA/TolQ/ExbB proton channel family protein [Lachnospiraceae bacterium]
MGFILQFISNYANTGIVMLGVIVALLLMWNGITLSNHKSRIEEALKRRNNKYIFHTSTKVMEEEEDQDSAITPDTIRKYETDFNKACSWHSVLIQFIPVFPLLGILGTVAGLMLEVQSGSADKMMLSLNLALETTLFGLIFAILLKIIEAVFPSRVIYDVEVMLDDFDKKLSIADMFQKLKEN